MEKLRIIYMGTPDFAVPAFAALVDGPHEVIAAYTQPPRPAGRGKKMQKSAVHKFAEDQGIPVYHPKSLKKADAIAEFADLGADLAIVAAYGLILPAAVLDAPRFGCLNIHGSLLPRWRGAAPIQRAIMAGDDKTGICIMQMDEGLDTGDVLMQDKISITEATTAQSLHDDLADMGARLTVEVVDMIASGTPPLAKPQPINGMTYAKMLSREDGKVFWAKPAADIERQIRALTPWPGVWCLLPDNSRLKIHTAEVVDMSGTPGTILDQDMTIACGHHALRLTRIQPENRKPMDGRSFLNGHEVKVGDPLK
tara:strand:- start:1216 stop:2145 length:930 start_codon:yes stop_codon:yes gene_type:complete